MSGSRLLRSVDDNSFDVSGGLDYGLCADQHRIQPTTPVQHHTPAFRYLCKQDIMATVTAVPVGETSLPSTTDFSNDTPYTVFTFDGQQDTANFGLPWSAPFPLAISVDDKIKSIPDAVEAIRQFVQSGDLHSLVKRHGGAILFRGLPLETPDDYSKVAHAFGFRPHIEVGRPPLRTVLAPNVKTANEGPPELPIWPHNEYGWSTINPAWLTFSALKIPEQGGATPITSSIYIAHHLSRLAPKFLTSLRSRGAKYTYRYTVNPLVSNTGTSIRGAYGEHVTDDDDEETARNKVEVEIRRHSENFEWHSDGSLSVTHVVPGKQKQKQGTDDVKV